VTALAAGTLKKTGAQFGIVIGEPARDPAGQASVWIALGSSPEEIKTSLVPMHGTGELAHASLVTQILDRLRGSTR
jgi:hypothetical protein